MSRVTLIVSILLILTVNLGINQVATYTLESIGSRIAGGQITTIEEFPYQAYISHFNRTHCGGSIINERTILTAAHCIALANQKELAVRLGVADISKNDGIKRNIAKTIVHEQYNDQTIENDIAILILEEPLEFSESIQPIDLPEQNEEIPAGSRAFVSGWGLVEENKSPSSILRFAEVFIVDHKECYKEIGVTYVTNKMICASRLDIGHPCSSDSGGPLAVYNNGERPKVAGVVSFGARCSMSGLPRVYTKVAAYRNWIESFMK